MLHAGFVFGCFFLGLPAAWLRVHPPVFHFFLSLFLLCVHRTEPHKATRTVSTRGHVLFTGVLCVACLLCVRFVLFFLSLCVCAPAFAG